MKNSLWKLATLLLLLAVAPAYARGRASRQTADLPYLYGGYWPISQVLEITSSPSLSPEAALTGLRWGVRLSTASVLPDPAVLAAHNPRQMSGAFVVKVWRYRGSRALWPPTSFGEPCFDMMCMQQALTVTYCETQTLTIPAQPAQSQFIELDMTRFDPDDGIYFEGFPGYKITLEIAPHPAAAFGPISSVEFPAAGPAQELMPRATLADLNCD